MVREQIRARGITSERVLAVMEQVPRERFVPERDRPDAFCDRALSIACGQTISQPFMVAAMTDCLGLEGHHRVLEIGTGSGYQTAILARLACEVYTIERIGELQNSARALLASLGITNVSYRTGDGSLGWPEQAPFDRIIVTAGAPEVPPSLTAQLTDSGRLVIPVGGRDEQILTIVERTGPHTREVPRFACRFVKLIGREAWREGGETESGGQADQRL
ncbi:MAG: protein-L-isoaspartate(D-aspartate) O-methyltransferase [Phycisphaerae bacterium]|nr:protein-L-isoaspartate(D-aspartate) O-methyltransferase [Phycisphaerae bacterium]